MAIHVVITGAAGFLGRALAQRLIADRTLSGQPEDQITLIDLAFDTTAPDGVRHMAGDLGDTVWLDSMLDAQTVDAVFHLASIPGGAAERDYPSAKRVNLDATQALLQLGQRQVQQGGQPPVFVFASSIAVFGDMAAEVNDDTPTRPLMTYGAQKLIGEVLIDDFSRRGWVDGRAVRIPGVLARPPVRTGQLSAFLSDIIRELAAGRPYVCPMSAEATTWASSLPCVVKQLLHAAALPASQLSGRRAVTLPTLHFAMSELVDAVAHTYGCPAQELVRYEPDHKIEALFGRYPPLSTVRAEQVGFQRDKDLDTLVRCALDSEPSR